MREVDYYNAEAKKHISWVYILERKGGVRSIHHSFNPVRTLGPFLEGLRLVFYRGFRDPMDSVAYKVFLQNLSFDSVSHIISTNNPKGENLSKELFLNYANSMD
jgi:hypothetical protein